MAKNKSKPKDGLLGLPTYQTVQKSVRQRRPRSWLANLTIRSACLYALYWILFACPSVPSENSPQICKRYYGLKQALVTKVVPLVQPHYDHYAGPYIAKGQPYYDQANKAYEGYAKPALKQSSNIYAKYADPVVKQGSNLARSQYNAKLAPHIDHRVNAASNHVRAIYEKYVGIYVRIAQDKYSRELGPYLANLQATAQHAYKQAQPYLESGLYHASLFYDKHVQPRLVAVFHWGLEFADKQILPVLRRFYLLNIEPQLNKVSDRFFHFNISNGFANLDTTAPDAVAASVSSSILASNTKTIATQSTVIAGETIVAENAEPSVDSVLQDRINHGIADDLLSIAENNLIKEGLAAREALESRLEDVLPALVKKESVLCADYLTQLESVTVAEVESVEKTILSFARAESNKGRGKDEIAEELRNYFVRAGKRIHSEAVEVKAHTSTALDTLVARVQKISYSVYEQVVAEAANQKKAPEQMIRFEMPSATKHEIRRLEALDQTAKKIGEDLDQAATSMLKTYTKELTKLVKDTDSKVEALAGGAANKLHTLHSVGPKKIIVGDDSEEFGHGYLPIGAMLNVQAIYNQISTGVYGTPEPTPVHEAVLETLKSFVKDVTGSVDLNSIASAANFAASVASEQGVNAASAVSSAVVGIDTDAIASSASSAASVASSFATKAFAAMPDLDTDAAKASVLGARDYVGEQAADMAAGASEAIYGTPPAFTESLVSRASEAVYGSQTPLAQSILSGAHNAFDAISEKLSEVVQGTPIPITESIASRASAAIYGTTVPLAESLLSQAAGAYEAVADRASEIYNGEAAATPATQKIADKVSEIVYGTEPPVLDSVASQLHGAYESVVDKASEFLHGSEVSSASKAASSSLSSASSAASVAAVASASSASSLASVASVSASKSASSASSAAAEEIPVTESIIDNVGERFEAAKEKLEEVVGAFRNRVEL